MESFAKQICRDVIWYMFCDAVYESLRLHKSTKKGILVVWGDIIFRVGYKVLLSMKLGNKESHEDWLEIFRDLKTRGLSDPGLGTTDEAVGLIKAFEEVFSKSLRQRCLVHKNKKRNILSKVSQSAIPEIKIHLSAISTLLLIKRQPGEWQKVSKRNMVIYILQR